ncbi:hypothetical protein V6B11_007885 [Vibrio anguillarum]|uniref:hypothetical protein n=2 Tax=Vibrio anguillarum TaxID=55601 RepID=UPI00097E29D4|nr:hypothetical protein [Vibrio anguillarum]MBT2911837.1 hypothetical protein [Vibrio anguillarum]MBT2944078.1 hypothetical protein [Vibrio anguillarum]
MRYLILLFALGFSSFGYSRDAIQSDYDNLSSSGECELFSQSNSNLSSCLNSLEGELKRQSSDSFCPSYSHVKTSISDPFFIYNKHRYMLVAHGTCSNSSGTRNVSLSTYFYANKIIEVPLNCVPPQILDSATNTCIDPPKCPDAGTVYEKTYGPSGYSGFTGCRPNNCVIQIGSSGAVQVCTGVGTDKESCGYTSRYTGQACTFDANNSKWQQPGHQWPDVPKPDVPNIGQPDPDLPDSGSGGGYNPDEGIEKDPTPPNPDTSPDTDNPNLDKEGNDGVINELNSANKSLQNIDSVLDDTLRHHKDSAKKDALYNSGILGALNKIETAVSNIKPGGGGGGGDGGDGECPEGEDCSGAVASYDCESEKFECEGDVIQCLSAEIQFKNHCINSELSDLEVALKKITSVDNVAAIVQEEQVDLSKIDSKYLNGSGLHASGQCPPDYVFTVDIYTSVTVKVPLSELCLAVERFSFIVILLGWVSGIGLVGRMQGVF